MAPLLQDAEPRADDGVDEREGVVVNDHVVNVRVNDDLEDLITGVEHGVDADAILHDDEEVLEGPEQEAREVRVLDVVVSRRGAGVGLPKQAGRGDRIVRSSECNGESFFNTDSGTTDDNVSLAVITGARPVDTGAAQGVDVDGERSVTIVHDRRRNGTTVPFGTVAVSDDLRSHDVGLAERKSATGSSRVQKRLTESVDDARVRIRRTLLERREFSQPSSAQLIGAKPCEAGVRAVGAIDLLQHARPDPVVVGEAVVLLRAVAGGADLREPPVDSPSHHVVVGIIGKTGVAVDAEVEKHVADARGDAIPDQRVDVLTSAGGRPNGAEVETSSAGHRLGREGLRREVRLVQWNVAARTLGAGRVHLEAFVTPQVEEPSGLRDGLEADVARPCSLLADLRKEAKLSLWIERGAGSLVIGAEVAGSLLGNGRTMIFSAIDLRLSTHVGQGLQRRLDDRIRVLCHLSNLQ